MKIAISAEGPEENSNVGHRFGVSNYLLIIELDTKDTEVIPNYAATGSGAPGMQAAGIISVGPIYAWYPLLKDLREKGAGNHLIAIFLGNRAIKPFLLPVMISYFGWIYVFVLTVLTILGSLAIGYTIKLLLKSR